MATAEPGADRARAGRPTDHVEARTDRRDVALGVGLALAVTAIALWHRPILNPLDPWHYVEAARFFGADDLWIPLGYTRYGLILPIVPFAALWGDAQATYFAFPVITSTALVVALYLLGARAYGRAGGLVAVGLFVTNPVVLQNYLFVYPDLPSMAVLCWALYLAFLARDRLAERGRGRRRVPVGLLLAVGFLLGWGFEIRETSLFAWPVIAWVLWRRGTVVRTAVLVGLPLLAWAALDVGISAIAYGDPWLKYHTLAGQDLAPWAEANADYLGKPRSFYLEIVPRLVTRESGGIWIFVVAALAVLGLAVRRPPVRMYALWFVLMYVLYVVQGGLLDPDHPAVRLATPRYWIAWFAPMVLAATGTLVAAAAAVRRRLASRAPAAARVRTAVTAMLVLVVLIGPVVSAGQQLRRSQELPPGPAALDPAEAAKVPRTDFAFVPNGGDALERLRDHLATRDLRHTTIYTDWVTQRILPPHQYGFFGGEVWKARDIRKLPWGREFPQPGDYVLLFDQRSRTCVACTYFDMAWLRRYPLAPTGWQEEWASPNRNLVLYRVLRSVR